MCNVKGVDHSDEPTENCHNSAVLHNCIKLFSLFQPIVLVSQPMTLLFDLVLPLSSNSFAATVGSCFQRKGSDKPTVLTSGQTE